MKPNQLYTLLLSFMGTAFFDAYSLLHFASGVIAYFWGVRYPTWFWAHAAFEVAENSPWGMTVINALPVWPGGKNEADTVLNMVGDQVFAMVGWWAAMWLKKSKVEW